MGLYWIPGTGLQEMDTRNIPGTESDYAKIIMIRTPSD